MDKSESYKINMRNPVMKSRVKKYDTYQQRRNFNRRNNSTLESDVHSVPVVETHIKKSSLQITAHHKHASSSIQQKPNPQVRYVHKQHTQNSITNSRKPSSNPVALRAVRQAQIYDNELYPDNDITLYAKSKRKSSLIQKSMYGFGVIVLLFSAFVSVQTFINNKQAKELVATLGENSTNDEQGVSQGTGDEPSEEEVSQSAIASYTVSNPENPRFIRIPEISVFARVKNLGIDGTGAVDSPGNIFDAGWYNGSVRPSSKSGSSLILGHVSGWTGPGIFKNINKLVEGSKFEIEKGSGQRVTYTVTRTEKLPVEQVDMSKILTADVLGEHDIKLMTCAGKYNNQTKTFDDRFIVYAKPII